MLGTVFLPRQGGGITRHGLEIGPAHGLVGGATRSVGFENRFYGPRQPRLASSYPATTAAGAADAL